MLAQIGERRQSFFVHLKKDGSGTGLPDGLFSNQKSKYWVNFGGSCNGRRWHILWTLGLFYGVLLYFIDIWYSLW
jgi:hypothetical protein